MAKQQYLDLAGLETYNDEIQTQLAGKAPKSHASSATTYGAGTDVNYGHVKLSDSTSSTSGASAGIAATPAAVKAAYDLANGKANSSHTHNYAGSSSAGGAATSANKLNTDAGSTTQPVYFEDGVPKATTYTLGASVPSGAKFTDTVYTLPAATSSALGGVKSGGDVTISSAGVITVNDDSHNHTIANIDTLQDALDTKVPTSRTVNGKALSDDITLSASDVGAAASSHSHSSYVNQNAFSNVAVGSTTIAADSTTDTLTVAGGTGISVSADATNDKVTITNSGVHSITTGTSNGTISVNTNGSSANVAVKGLGTAAYTASTAYDAAGAANTALASAKTYTDDKIDAIVGEGASETLDTIGEISAAITDNQEMLDTLNDAIGNKSAKTHTHTVSHTPAGTVSKPTFTGTEASTTSISGTTTVYSITDVGTLPSCTYTAPSHSYTAPSLAASCSNRCLTLTFSAGSHSFSAGSHSFSAGKLPTKGSGVSVATGTHTHKYTPAGTVSQPTFTGTAATLTTSAGN